jgi:transposase
MKPGNPMLAAQRETDRHGFRERLRIALAESGGDVRAAAARLGVHFTTLYRWLQDEPDLKPAEPTS